MISLFRNPGSTQQRATARHKDNAQQLLKRIHGRWHDIRHVQDGELLLRADELRSRAIGHSFDDDCILNAFALVAESLRRTNDIVAFDVQMLAGLALVRGYVAEMQTGEGKTVAAAFPAFTFSLAGRGVHVATANAYLADRDCCQLAPVFELLGATAACIQGGQPPTEKQEAYRSDITYGPGYEFGFDYLRDQLALRSRQPRPVGHDFLRILRGHSVQDSTLQRPLAFAIVDEIDNVLIDDASSPLLLAEAQNETATDEAAHKAACDIATKLQPNADFVVDASTGSVTMTSTGHDRIWHYADSLPLKQVLRPWTSYIEQALRARYLFQRDAHYVVRDGRICIVDPTTGRLFEERTWRDGLHQAVEALEGVPITADPRSTASITKQRYFRYYPHLCGMTGTAQGAEAEFAEFYQLGVVCIPTRLPSQRRVLPPVGYADSEQRAAAIATDAVQRSRQGQPTLIGTRSILQSEQLAQCLSRLHVDGNLLTGTQDADEAAVIAQAGRAGTVTIATSMAGRGTDIVPDRDSLARGGLHVIAVAHHESRRIDRQLIGRAARQGQPGSAQFHVCADDELLAQHAPRACQRLLKATGKGQPVSTDVTRLMEQVQQQVEKKQYRRRQQLFLADQQRGDVLKQLTGDAS